MIVENPDVRYPEFRLAPEIEAFVRSMDQPSDGARAYLETHIARIARTLSMTPAPGPLSRVLELGAYMHMTPALHCVLGYREVEGAYYGASPRNRLERLLRRFEKPVDRKRVTVGGKVVFECNVTRFDAEKDPWPYPDSSFDTVLACEIFEHFLHDPMHMLIEARRVLRDGGALVLTTPNVASFTAVSRVLNQDDNPQLYSKYPNPMGEFSDTEVGHMREYTPLELETALIAGGYRVEYLFTETAPGYEQHRDLVKPFLEANGYAVHLRGEQIYSLARKDAAREVTRYPGFLYDM